MRVESGHVRLLNNPSLAAVYINTKWCMLTVVIILHQSGISIGLPVGGTPEGCMYMLNHSKTQFVFAEDHQQVDKVLQVRQCSQYVKKTLWLVTYLFHRFVMVFPI